MGARRAFVVVVRLVAPFLAVFSMLSGCQSAGLPTAARLLDHRIQVDDSGLMPAVAASLVKINVGLPAGWDALSPHKSMLYTHQQWRSPSKHTAVGVTYVRMPLPLSTQALVWMATREVGKQTNGKILRQWTDELGRSWFEAENEQYHMTGYVMTRGTDAWINYCGYRLSEDPKPREIELGHRSLETILPLSAVTPEQVNSTAHAQ